MFTSNARDTIGYLSHATLWSRASLQRFEKLDQGGGMPCVLGHFPTLASSAFACLAICSSSDKIPAKIVFGDS